MTLSNAEINALYHIQDALKTVPVESIEYLDDAQPEPWQSAWNSRNDLSGLWEIREQYEHIQVTEDGHDLKELQGVSVAYEGSLPSEIDNREVMLTINGVRQMLASEGKVDLSILVSESDGSEYKIDDLECTEATC